MADRPEGGIRLGECSQLNRGIGALLDEKDFLSGRYILEVSSPGLDRPLKTKNDLSRKINCEAHFFLNEEVKRNPGPTGGRKKASQMALRLSELRVVS